MDYLIEAARGPRLSSMVPMFAVNPGRELAGAIPTSLRLNGHIPIGSLVLLA